MSRKRAGDSGSARLFAAFSRPANDGHFTRLGRPVQRKELEHVRRAAGRIAEAAEQWTAAFNPVAIAAPDFEDLYRAAI